MKLDTEKISGIQMSLLLVGFLLGSSVLLFPGQLAEHEAWLATLIGLTEGVILIFLYTELTLRFPGKTLVEIMNVVYGSFLGKIISACYIIYFLLLGSLVIVDYHDFIKLVVLPLTPSSVVVLVSLIVNVYSVKKGIEVVARCSQGMVIIVLILFLLITGLLIFKVDFNNFRPFFSVPLSKLLWAGHAAGAFPYGESVVFMMLFPCLNKSKEVRSWVLKGMLLVTFFFMLGSLRTVGVLGKSAQIYIYPGFQSGRLINVADVFTRLEIIIALNFLIMGFLKGAVLLYSTSLGMAQLFKLNAYQPLVLPIGLLMGLLALIDFSNPLENLDFSLYVYPVFVFPFQVGIPFLTLIVASIRKLPQGGNS